MSTDRPRTQEYTAHFYDQRHERTVHAARTVLGIVTRMLPPIRSAVDLGCGVGAWLSVLRELGVEAVQGLAGPWVEDRQLRIPRESFLKVDLDEPVRLERRYDLAISLEVAEHLSPDRASSFVGSLTGLSDFVLFSAAIPFQEGKNHINEQWPEYWADLFRAHGHVTLDVIRRRIWSDKAISAWYRQNILLFARKDRAHEVRVEAVDGVPGMAGDMPLAMVHPEVFLEKLERTRTVGGTWKLFRRAVRAFFHR
jgi:hypothetical protein